MGCSALGPQLNKRAAWTTGLVFSVLSTGGGGGGGGLTSITETLLTASPNNIVNVEQLAVSAGVGSTRVDINLMTKGNGVLFLGPAPDGGTGGGGSRVGAVDSVDFQVSRSAANQVNKGVRSFMGGKNNEIFNTNSESDFCFGNGHYLQGAGGNVMLGGAGNVIGPAGNFSASNCFLGGGSANSSIANGGAHALVGGGSNTLSGGSGSGIIGGNGHYVTGGSYNFIGGGRLTAMSGGGSQNTSIGGFNNANYSITGSFNCQIGCQTSPLTGSGNFNMMLGCNSSNVSGDSNFVNGGVNAVSGNNNFVIGYTHTADGSYCSMTGAFGAARGAFGLRLHTATRRVANGDQQSRFGVFVAQTTNATVTALTTDAAVPSATNQLKLITASVYKVKGQVVGLNRATSDVCSFDFSATLKNVGGTVTVVGTPTVTQQAADSALTATAVTITADNVLKCVSINVAGIAATTIDWVASAETVEAA